MGINSAIERITSGIYMNNSKIHSWLGIGKFRHTRDENRTQPFGSLTFPNAWR